MRNSIGRLAGFAALFSAVVIVGVLASCPAPFTTAADRVEGALALYGAGNQAGCDRILSDLVLSDPRAPETWLLAGLLAETRHTLADAERAYGKVLSLLDAADPRTAEVQVSLADLTRQK